MNKKKNVIKNNNSESILNKKDQPFENKIKFFKIEKSFQTLFSFKESVLKNFIKITNFNSSIFKKIPNQNDQNLKKLTFLTKKNFNREYWKNTQKTIILDIKNNFSFHFSKKNHK